MRRKWVAVSLGLLTMVLLGTGAWSVAHSKMLATKYRIATYSGSVSLLSLMGPGILAGQANPDDTACLWVGDGRDRIVLIWPSGYTARAEPLTVVDGDGKQVAVVGRQVQFGGGFSIQGDSGPKAVWGCGQVSRSWLVGSTRSTRAP